MRTIRIGTRGSRLALVQTDFVKQALFRNFPDLALTEHVIKTTGDILADTSLTAIGGKGVFVKQIENRLLRGEIDMAVHSLKDMPSSIPPGLAISAFLEREDPRDMLFSQGDHSLASLPLGARVGTSSLRRKCQLLALRPDIICVDIRGNVPTRLSKIGADFDAVILAAAGVRRLGLPQGSPIDVKIMIPSPGQGIIAVETSAEDHDLMALLQTIDHGDTRLCALAERAFLAKLGADCRIPAAAYATIDKGHLSMDAMIGKPDGKRMVRMSMRGDSPDIGSKLAEALLDAFYRGVA
jgi:hydroxymethylbilane synthase